MGFTKVASDVADIMCFAMLWFTTMSRRYNLSIYSVNPVSGPITPPPIHPPPLPPPVVDFDKQATKSVW